MTAWDSTDPLLTRIDTPWMSAAACIGMPTDMFFPPRGGHREIDTARQVCARCPVRVECLEYSFELGVKDGVWGGLSGRERRPLLAAWHAGAPVPVPVPVLRRVRNGDCGDVEAVMALALVRMSALGYPPAIDDRDSPDAA